MNKTKPTQDKIIRYWDPRKGGWYHAKLIREGYKFAVVEPLNQKGQKKRLFLQAISKAVF